MQRHIKVVITVELNSIAESHMGIGRLATLDKRGSLMKLTL